MVVKTMNKSNYIAEKAAKYESPNDEESQSEDNSENDNESQSDSVSQNDKDSQIDAESVDNKQSEQNDDSSTSSESSAHDSDEEEEGDEKGNIGWADSIAKVLKTNKPSKKNVLALSRAAKSSSKSKDEATKTYNFEIEGEEEKPDQKVLNAAINQFKKQKNTSLLLRSKPSSLDIERERTLKKIATRGVVQLFNAVRVQQKDIQQQLKEVGPLDHKKDAVLNNINKRKFLDVLMSGKRSKSEVVDNPVKKEEHKDSSDEDSDSDTKSKKKSEWSVLRDDFMTNKKLKNWDQDDSDSGDAAENESDGSSD